MHLSHVIQDLEQFYEAPKQTYKRRSAEMFSAHPLPPPGNANQFTNGGGPAFLPNRFVDPRVAEDEAKGIRAVRRRSGTSATLSALQRTSRATDGLAIYIRADGPGFDSLDVPDGSPQPKLHFSIFVPTAGVLRDHRRSQASLDLAQKYNVPAQNLGLERFLHGHGRQNYLGAAAAQPCLPARRARPAGHPHAVGASINHYGGEVCGPLRKYVQEHPAVRGGVRGRGADRSAPRRASPAPAGSHDRRPQHAAAGDPSYVHYFSTSQGHPKPIQEAVNAATHPRDFVLIEPGTYEEEVKVRPVNKGIFIRGMNRNTVLLGG